jgi:ADP-ribosylglycohydrolase
MNERRRELDSGATAVVMTVAEALAGNAAGDALGHSTEHAAILAQAGHFVPTYERS